MSLKRKKLLLIKVVIIKSSSQSRNTGLISALWRVAPATASPPCMWFAKGTETCVCVCVLRCAPSPRNTVQMWGGGERRARQKREKNRCDAVMLRVGGARQGGGRPRQVAAHVKPLSADSNDTERRLLTRLTQPCVCVCVSASL